MSGETTITIQGNLTSDPELRYTQNGLAVANFTIASTPKVWDKQSNQSKDGEALFMRCSVWRDFAENVAGSLTKGMRVVAVGHLKQRSYETKEGEKRTSIELDIEAIGPDLRFASAFVTRNNSEKRSRGAEATSNQSQAPADEPWSATPQTPAGDVWNTPGSFNDETPF